MTSLHETEINQMLVERNRHLEETIFILVNKPHTKEAKRLKQTWGLEPALVGRLDEIREVEGQLTCTVLSNYRTDRVGDPSVTPLSDFVETMPLSQGGISVINDK